MNVIGGICLFVGLVASVIGMLTSDISIAICGGAFIISAAIWGAYDE